MKKTWKKTLGVVLSLSMIAGTIVLPAATASAAVGDSWKFDFGATAANGWTQVAKDKQLTQKMIDGITGSTAAGTVYGLLGLDEDAYLVGSHVDGVTTEEKQQLIMKEGAKSTVATEADDYIAFDKTVEVEGQDDIPGDYPIRFSMNAENNHYYKVKATVTTFDAAKPATVSVFSERRHPILLEETLEAGQVKEVTFTATLQNVYIKGRDGRPNITYADNLLNVVVVGDNAALAAIEVEEVEHQPTMWLYDDSTGCDYAMLQPYFPLQNYGGTGAFLTKYLPEGITISNQGDGGIDASDSSHWDAAKANISAGDYVYVQYGHNHKNDGAAGYVQHLKKYYTHAHSKGAKTIYVGPIDRHNADQFKSITDEETDEVTYYWSSTLGGFSKAAKYYTELLICGGTDLADQFAAKIKEAGGTSISDDIYTWADTEIAKGITSAGVDDVAFVDLNQPTLDWLEDVCAEVQTIRNADVQEKNATDYYFRAVKGGGVDGTHANDAGADNTASFFFSEAAKTVAAASTEADATKKAILEKEAAVLTPLVTSMRTTSDKGYVVSEDIVKLGKAPNSAWPVVYTLATPSKYPTAITSIDFNTDGTIKQATALKQFAEDSMSAYGIVVVDVKDSTGELKGQFLANDQIDNTVDSEQTVKNFRAVDAEGNATTDLKLEEGGTYSAIVMQALDANETLPLRVDTEANHPYSIVYEPVNITKHYVYAADDTPVEKFYIADTDYSGETSIVDKDNWRFGGSASREALLNVLEGDTEEENMYYLSVSQTATKEEGGSGSAYLTKKLGTSEEAMTIGTTGKYMVKAKLSYFSGGGAQFGLTEKLDGINTPNGSGITLFTLDSNGVVKAGGKDAGVVNKNKWATVTYILDMDLGKATITVDGYDPVEVDVTNYQTTGEVSPASSGYFIVQHSKDTAFGIGIAELTIAQIEQGELPYKTIEVTTNDAEKGSVAVTSDPEEAIEEIDVVTGTQIGYANGKATVYSDKAGKLTLIEAKYTAANALTEIKPTELTFTADELSKEVTVTDGSKLMLWENLAGVKPVLSGVTATGTITPKADKAKSAPISTFVTYKATPTTGNIFTGWKSGSTIVSIEPEYTVRLRDDMSLEAQFAVQHDVTGTVGYKLKADKTSVKSGTAETVTVEEYDVLDNTNNPVKYDKTTEVAWSIDAASTTAGASIAGGVVTIPADFNMGTDMVKTITVTAVINNITKTFDITVHSYEFFENFDSFDNDDEKHNGWTVGGQGALSQKTDSSGRKYLAASGGGSGNRNSSYVFDAATIRSIKEGVLKVSFELMRSSNAGVADRSHMQIALSSADSVTANGETGGVIWDINQSLSGVSTFSACTINGSGDKSITFKPGEWYTVEVYIDLTNNKVSYVISGGDLTAPIAEYNLDKTVDHLGHIHLLWPRGGGDIGLDNLAIGKVSSMPTASAAE